MNYVWNCVLSSATMPIGFPQNMTARQGQHLLQVLFLGWDDSHGSHTSVRKENAGDTPLPIWCGFTRIHIMFMYMFIYNYIYICIYILCLIIQVYIIFMYVYKCLHMVHVFSLTSIGLFLLQFYIPLSQLEHCNIPRSMTDRNVIEERLCKRLL